MSNLASTFNTAHSLFLKLIEKVNEMKVVHAITIEYSDIEEFRERLAVKLNYPYMHTHRLYT